MINQNTLRYLTNFSYQICHFSSPKSPQINFQSNKGNLISREPDYNLQSGQPNSNDTIILEVEKTYSSL